MYKIRIKSGASARVKGKASPSEAPEWMTTALARWEKPGNARVKRAWPGLAQATLAGRGEWSLATVTSTNYHCQASNSEAVQGDLSLAKVRQGSDARSQGASLPSSQFGWALNKLEFIHCTLRDILKVKA